MCVTAPNSDNGHYSTGHAGHQTLQAFLMDIGPLIKQGLAEFMEVMWVMIHVFLLRAPIRPPEARWGCSQGIVQAGPF